MALQDLRSQINVEQFYECPKEFLTLDRKLAKYLSQVLPKFLLDLIAKRETAYHMEGQQIKGRQIRWVICRELFINTDLGFTYSIADLSLMPFPGDKNLQRFLNKWDEILSCIDRKRNEPATLAKLFPHKLIDSTVMKAEVDRWRRLEAGHPDKSYEWLRKSIGTNLRLDKEDRNQDNYAPGRPPHRGEEQGSRKLRWPWSRKGR